LIAKASIFSATFSRIGFGKAAKAFKADGLNSIRYVRPVDTSGQPKFGFDLLPRDRSRFFQRFQGVFQIRLVLDGAEKTVILDRHHNSHRLFVPIDHNSFPFTGLLRGLGKIPASVPHRDFDHKFFSRLALGTKRLAVWIIGSKLLLIQFTIEAWNQRVNGIVYTI
jgi:hypothetical protein